ncbi:MAG: hypothetical protein IKI93_19155 [Clostridia bacterium]|nr:hypothetical protein [Clostridia bacterium]
MTKKKLVFLQLAYYAISLIVYILFFLGVSFLLDLSGEADNLGAVIAVTYGILFLMTPMLVGVLMRFSLLRWYVDPFAAAEIPLFLYLGMIVKQWKHAGELRAAFLLVNRQLADDGGEGWFFIIGLFLFGLIMSLSFSRKKGRSISYRILSKITKTELQGDAEE